MDCRITKAMTEKSIQVPPPERETGSWEVFSERNCRTWLLSRCAEASVWIRTAVSVHVLSPLTDRIE